MLSRSISNPNIYMIPLPSWRSEALPFLLGVSISNFLPEDFKLLLPSWGSEDATPGVLKITTSLFRCTRNLQQLSQDLKLLDLNVETCKLFLPSWWSQLLFPSRRSQVHLFILRITISTSVWMTKSSYFCQLDYLKHLLLLSFPKNHKFLLPFRVFQSPTSFMRPRSS